MKGIQYTNDKYCNMWTNEKKKTVSKHLVCVSMAENKGGSLKTSFQGPLCPSSHFYLPFHVSALLEVFTPAGRRERERAIIISANGHR